jgi:C4-dicarboxylate-specific signal transduction histidine kinase
VQQVVLNLLKNAEDILLEKKIDKPVIKIKIYEKLGKNIIKISDNATGIPADVIDKIFDPYFTTKDKKNGTGLGLYMSKRIIENRCGGTLIVDSNSSGAKFKIVL